MTSSTNNQDTDVSNVGDAEFPTSIGATSRLIRRRPSIDTLPKDDQEKLYQRERVIRYLIELRHKYGRIPRGERRAAANELKVGWRMVHEYMERYIAYQEAFPDEDAINAFVPFEKLGRPEGTGQVLTEVHKRVLRYAILERRRRTRYASGQIETVPDYQFEIFDVYRFTKKICPDICSYDTVRRYINGFRKHNPALFKYFTEGRDKVEEESLAKRHNDVIRPNQRWQSDVRYLPFYVLVDGEPCPVSLIIIYDDYSRYVIAWKLVISTKRTKDGRLGRNHVTARDVCELLARAMRMIGIRPEEFYTDNGAEYIALLELLPKLANDPPIRFVRSRPRKPWGRGKAENGLGQVTRLLRRIARGFRKDKKRPSIDEARKSAKLSQAELEEEFAQHFKEVNTKKPKTRGSRAELWNGKVALPAPPIRKLVHLDLDHKYDDSVTVHKQGINFVGIEWEAKELGVAERDRDIQKRWADAVESDESYVVWAVRLDTVWQAEIDLNGVWVELVPKTPPNQDGSYNRAQQAALKDMRVAGRQLIAEGLETIKSLVPELPARRTTDGEYVFVEKSQVAKSASGRKRQKDQGSEQPAPTGRKDHLNSDAEIGARISLESVSTENDDLEVSVSPFDDMDEVMRQIEEQLKRQG